MSSIHNHNEFVLKGSNLTLCSSAALPGWDVGSYSGMMAIWILFCPRFDL